MHGGRWAIAGFLYQTLGSLGHVGQIAVSDARFVDDRVKSLQLTLEPEGGGDARVEYFDKRIVEQYKLRESGRTWSASEIIDEVLTDLLRATASDVQSGTTAYRFVTNGRVAAEPFRELLEAIAKIGPTPNPLSALDDREARYRYKKRRLTAQAFFQQILEGLGVVDATAEQLWGLLSHFEIHDQRTEEYFVGLADDLLALVVDHREDVPSKRDALIGRLFRRARTGEAISPAKALSDVGINPQRLEQRNQTLHRLQTQTRRALTRHDYIRALDARNSAPPQSESFMTVLTGESGQGKTWQLLRLAHEYISQGKPCVVFERISSLEQLERALVGVLWHESGYDSSRPLVNVLERLANILPEPPETKLTVFIDDLQDRDFANRLLGSDLDQLGLRFVVSAQSRIVKALQGSPRGIAETIHIDRFSIPEFRNYLSQRGIEWTDVPHDVPVDLLRQPLMTKLYADIASKGWVPESEYALLQRFWRHLTAERKGQDDHPESLTQNEFLYFNVLRVALLRA